MDVVGDYHVEQRIGLTAVGCFHPSLFFIQMFPCFVCFEGEDVVFAEIDGVHAALREYAAWQHRDVFRP